MLKILSLSNGLKVASYTIPQMKSAFVTLSVKGGSIFDRPDKSGAAHYMEHILVQGTPSYPTVEGLAEYIESMAGSFNASTFTQSIRFNINAPARYLEDMLTIAGEVFFKPLFTTESIEKERNAVLEEIRSREDTLWFKNNRFFDQIRFKKNHPMLLDPGGTRESVEKLKKNDLTSYWKKFFDPSNAYLVLVGGYNQAEAEKFIINTLGNYPSTKKFVGFPKLSNRDMSQSISAIREDFQLQTCYLDLSWPSVSDNAPLFQRIVQGIARSILGNLNSSRLYRILREQKGLVYHVGFGAASYQGFGYCYITSQVMADLIDEVIQIIVNEVKEFVRNGPTQKELDFAKNYVVNRTLMQFDNPLAIASWIEGDLIWEEKVYTVEEYINLVERVDIDTLKEFMQKYWEFDKLNITIQGPVKNNQENIDRFLSLVKPLQ